MYGDFEGFIGILLGVEGQEMGSLYAFGPWLKRYASQLDTITDSFCFKKSSDTALVLYYCGEN